MPDAITVALSLGAGGLRVHGEARRWRRATRAPRSRPCRARDPLHHTQRWECLKKRRALGGSPYRHRNAGGAASVARGML